MKLFFFVFTVFFMLTVTLQESLAQAATKPDEAQAFVEKFSQPSVNFAPQAYGPGPGLSTIEGGSLEPVYEVGKADALSSNLDRNTESKRAESNAASSNLRQTVKDAIGGGSSAKSDR